MIISSQKPLHTHQTTKTTDEHHALIKVRSRNPGNQSNADLLLRSQGHREQLTLLSVHNIFLYCLTSYAGCPICRRSDGKLYFFHPFFFFSSFFFFLLLHPFFFFLLLLPFFLLFLPFFFLLLLPLLLLPPPPPPFLLFPPPPSPFFFFLPNYLMVFYNFIFF